MAWQDRLREAAYTSPGGTRLTFQYVAVKISTSKRTTVFEFPGVDEAYVQDNGHGPRTFPLRVLFSGSDHDTEAETFEAALLERGVGRLDHPFYGTFDVVPTGTITRRDDLQRAANQTTLEVTFSTSLAEVYPQLSVDLRGAVEAALLALAEAGGEQFGAAADMSTVGRQETAKAALRDDLKKIGGGLEDLSAATAKVRRAFNDAQKALDDGLDALITEPLALAGELAGLLQLPAQAGVSIRARLDGYVSLLDNIIAGPRAEPWEAIIADIVLPGRRRTVANDFHTAVLTANSVVGGAVRAVLETDFDARPFALEAADTILKMLDTSAAWQDLGFATLHDAGTGGDIDTGEAYQALYEAVQLTAGYLVELSFSLQPERRIVLGRPRTIIDLAAELYGSVSNETLDFLISSNELSGSEILEIPRGRAIVYYRA